ncbi:MAG TPA: lysylphosphatidylglycerol synthase domain-containing protein [Gemmataceae bacterium]|nr:lysylphosphatidylglycerol synthase domain-containing protein [Gemmataceae bacterium]
MPSSRKRLWLVVKTLLAAAIVVGVGRQFFKILSKPEFDPYPFRLRVEYLVPAALLYLGAHTLWGLFWVRLLRSQGVNVSRYVGLRAYFVSQFGKYVPGKAWVILIRVAMLKAVGGRTLPVAVTATYETLTSMAAGAMLGVLLLPWLGVLPAVVSRNVAFLVAIACLPVGLAVLNKLAVRIANKKRAPDAPPLPSPGLRLLARGLLQAACGWCLLGLSLGLVVAAVAPNPPAWNPQSFLGDLAAVSLSYIVGFVVLVAPGGIGARELVLTYALTPRFAGELGGQVAEGLAVVVALVLRLAWTAAEVALALGLWARPAAVDPVAQVSRPVNR